MIRPALLLFSFVACIAMATPGRDVRRGLATLTCDSGWRGSAAGEVDGIPFTVSCLPGTVGRSVLLAVGRESKFSARVGVESSSTGADCAFSGTVPNQQKCIGVTLSLR